MMPSSSHLRPAGTDLAASSQPIWARFVRYRMVFRKYWWVVVFTAALGVGIAAWNVASHKVVYVSTARMMVSGKINLPESGTFSEEMSLFMKTQAELMKDEAVCNRAEARL